MKLARSLITILDTRRPLAVESLRIMGGNGLNMAELLLGLVILTAWKMNHVSCAASSPESRFHNAEHSYADPQALTHTNRGPVREDREVQETVKSSRSLLGEFPLGGSAETMGPEQGRSSSMFSSLATILPVLLSTRRGESNTGSNQINIAELLRMFGVDSNKIGTIVINAIVHIIETVGNHFLGGNNSILESRNQMDYPGAFLFKLFDTRRAEKFLRLIANPDYPNNIISDLKAATGNDTVCIQQLICKLSPFWWGVNRSVRDFLPIALGKDHSSPLLKMGWRSLIMKYIPSIKDFSDNSDLCETRHSGCIVMSFWNGTNAKHSQH